MEEIEDIALEIKGRFRMVYVVCFKEEKEDIEEIFNSHAICNKGIPQEGVEFVFIDRKSFILPNPNSRLQPSNLLPGNNSRMHP